MRSSNLGHQDKSRNDFSIFGAYEHFFPREIQIVSRESIEVIYGLDLCTTRDFRSRRVQSPPQSPYFIGLAPVFLLGPN